MSKILRHLNKRRKNHDIAVRNENVMDERATTAMVGLLIESKWLAILAGHEKMGKKEREIFLLEDTKKIFFDERKSHFIFVCASSSRKKMKSALKNKHHQQLYQQSDIFTVSAFLLLIKLNITTWCGGGGIAPATVRDHIREKSV